MVKEPNLRNNFQEITANIEYKSFLSSTSKDVNGHPLKKNI